MAISVTGCAAPTSQLMVRGLSPDAASSSRSGPTERHSSTRKRTTRRGTAAEGGKRAAIPRLTAVVLALLAIACGDDGGTATPAAPTPTYPEVGGRWEGALHDTRRSGPPEWDVEPCNSLTSCAVHELVEADLVQDGGDVTGTVTFAEGSAAPVEFAIRSGTISTAGALRLTFDTVEVSIPELGIRTRWALTWEAQVDGTSMTGTVTVQGTSSNPDVLPGTAVFQGCLGPVSPAECSGWRR